LINQENLSAVRGRQGQADCNLYRAGELAADVRARSWQLIRNRRLLAEITGLAEQSRLLLARNEELLA
jgi:hypothetical protein